jgi:hypothetical protein
VKINLAKKRRRKKRRRGSQSWKRRWRWARRWRAVGAESSSVRRGWKLNGRGEHAQLEAPSRLH